MKTSVTLIFFIISLPLHSQPTRIYSASINGGGFFPVENLQITLNTGYNFGVDIETRKNNFGIFLASKLNFFEFKNGGYIMQYGAEPEKETMTIGEFTFGGRWFLGKPERINANIDLALGIYTGSYFDEINSGFTPSIDLGIQPGIGGNIPVTKKLSANLNLKVNMFDSDNWRTYCGLYLGLRYSFNK